MKVKITKEKVKTFLTYESLKVLAVCVGACFLLFIIFNALTTKPTSGQEVNLLYDKTLILGKDVSSTLSSLTTLPKEGEKKNNFSYEALKVSAIQIESGNYNSEYILSEVHVKSFEDDMLVLGEELYLYYVNTNNAVDIPTFINGAIDYVTSNGFIVNGEFSSSAITDYFYATRSNDKRFKTKAQKEQGAIYEYDRITALYKQATALKAVFEAHPELLDERTFDFYGTSITGKYGVKLSELKGSEDCDIKNLFSRVVTENEDSLYTSEGIYLAFGENKEQTGDLYYETLAFLYELVCKYTLYV